MGAYSLPGWILPPTGDGLSSLLSETQAWCHPSLLEALGLISDASVLAWPKEGREGVAPALLDSACPPIHSRYERRGGGQKNLPTWLCSPICPKSNITHPGRGKRPACCKLHALPASSARETATGIDSSLPKKPLSYDPIIMH